MGPGKPWLNQGVLSAVFGGWQSSGITTRRPGGRSTSRLHTGVNNGAPSWPNRIGSGELDDPIVDLWFNPADFVAPPPNTYGDVGRGVLYSPGHRNVDLSLTRRFMFVGASNPQVRLEAFNLFNHPAFGFPNAAIGSPTVGRITTTVVDNRIMQFAVKFDF